MICPSRTRELIYPGMPSEDLLGEVGCDSPPAKRLDTELSFIQCSHSRGALGCPEEQEAGSIHCSHITLFFQRAHIMFADALIGRNLQKPFQISHSLQAPHPVLQMWNVPKSIKVLKSGT